MPNVTCVTHGTSGVCDMGIPACCAHPRSGTNLVGAELFDVEGKNVHCKTHTGSCNCPHGGSFASVEGAVLFEIGGLPVTLVGHATSCMACGKGGTHVTGTELLWVER